MGIEPNEHQIPSLWGNTAITLITQKTLGDPILPMFFLCLSDGGVWGFLVFMNLSVSQGNLGEEWD